MDAEIILGDMPVVVVLKDIKLIHLSVQPPVWRVHIQRMKTRWRSCKPEARAIRPNSELAKKPAACLEYTLAHELAHLKEHRHNDWFTSRLDAHMPQWSQYRELLNSLPLAHEAWGY